MSSEQVSPAAKGEDNDFEFWKDYAMAALEKWRDTERSITRIAGLMVIIAITFELINRKSVAEFNLPLVKLTNPNLVQTLLPLVVAYLFFNLAEHMAEADWSGSAYDDAFKRIGMHDPGNWYLGALTPAASITTAAMRTDYPRKGPIEKLAYAGVNIRLILFLIWPLLFNVYAYVELFKKHTQWTILTVVAGLLSLILLILSFAAVFSAPDRPEIDEQNANKTAPPSYTS